MISGRRRTGALLASGALLLVMLPFGGTAQAAPRTTKDWWYTRLDVAAANRLSTGSGVTVAVLDTGVQASLPDLRGRVVAGTSFFGTGDGRVDSPNKKVTYFGHGTVMAGLIAGTGAGAGMRGVAPGATILPVAVGAEDQSTDANIERGIVYAADHGAKVINLSLGGTRVCPPAMQQAIDHALRKDVIVVAATGNTPGVPVASPASCIGTIGVGGLADAAGFQPWSGGTTGPELDFVAPAQDIRGLLLDNTISAPNDGGTSNSTAFVSGTFALLRAKFPTESARQIVTRALWNVKNNLGGKIFAKRINDQLGYGEILPKFALTDAPPAGAANPIYDAIDAHLKASAASSASSASSSPGASSATTPPSSGAASTPPAAADEDSGGISSALVAAIVVIVVVVVALVIGAVVRSRRRTTTGAHPPAGGYGPPPGGPGPGPGPG